MSAGEPAELPSTPSQAELFATLVGNMLSPLKDSIAAMHAEVAAVRSIAAQCFEAVVRVEEQLRVQQQAIVELRGEDAKLRRELEELKRLIEDCQQRIVCLEAHIPAA